MNRKVLSLIILFFACITLVNAQEGGKITLRGVILDEKTGEPVPFANMGLLGTIAGTAADIDGKFELVIPDKYSTYLVRVSAVGYGSYETKVYEMKDKPDFRIMLKPVTYGIAEVDVYGQLLIYKKMLQNVVANIGKNYISTPYNYEGYFKYRVSVNGNERVKEAIVNIYDSEGYRRGDVAEAFQEVNYDFSEVRRNQAVSSVLDGLTCFDDILTADIVRNPRNVLDISNSRDYKLKNKGKIMYEGDSVRIIAYEVQKPGLSTSGDAAITKYDGEIYVTLKGFAVLKNIINIKSKDFNSLGRNLITVNEPAKGEVSMKIETTYKKLKSVYFLSGVSIQFSYGEGGDKVEGEMQYITTRVNRTNPKQITGRRYYEDIKTNENFWNRYSVYFEGEE